MNGGSVSAIQNLGIGYNNPEIGNVFAVNADYCFNENQVDTPTESLVYADAGTVTTNSASLDADAWVEVSGTGCSFFYSPTSAQYLPGAARAVSRHQGRVNAGFVDGHAASMKDSDLGWTLPRTDSGAFWARNHRGASRYDN